VHACVRRVNYFGGTWLAVLTLIVGISMVAGTCDKIQAGMIALFWPIAEKVFGTSTKHESTKSVFVVSFMVLLNMPPVLLALSGQSLLELLLFAQLLAATIIAPVLLGLWDRTHPHGALAGAFAGLITAMIVCSAGDEPFDLLLEEGGRYRRWWTWAFLITPAASALVTVGVSIGAYPEYRFKWSVATSSRSDGSSATKPQVAPTSMSKTRVAPA